MKKKLNHVTLFLSMVPCISFSLGLGNIHVDTLLDQPFKAEIALLEVGNLPLSEIKVKLASPENFAQISLPYLPVLDWLNFKVARNKKGQPVIVVSTEQRVTDPSLQFVIDLAWANGQMYRAYTVLLDPSDYSIKKTFSSVEPSEHLTKSKHGTVNNTAIRKQTVYGPTAANETVWQIAQRYLTPNVSLQQTVLAILGANPQAFEQDNLNSLKPNSQLIIPSSSEIAGISAHRAKEEVDAQDYAWQNKQPIKHVLMPPFNQTSSAKKPLESSILTSLNNSVITPVTPMHAVITNNNESNAIESNFSLILDKTNQTLKLEQANIAKLYQSNKALKAQLVGLENNYRQVQKQLLTTQTQLKKINQHLFRIIQDSNKPLLVHKSSTGWYILWLLIAAVAVIIGYWLYVTNQWSLTLKDRLKFLGLHKSSEESNDLPTQDKDSVAGSSNTSVIKPNGNPSKDWMTHIDLPPAPDEPISTLSSKPTSFDSQPYSEPLDKSVQKVNSKDDADNNASSFVLPKVESNTKTLLEAESSDDEISKPSVESAKAKEDNSVDFEPGLHKTIDASKNSKNNHNNLNQADEQSIEYQPVVSENLNTSNTHNALDSVDNPFADSALIEDPNLIHSLEQSLTNETLPKLDSKLEVTNDLITSTKALDTLLDLARTYISMNDKESAQQSLEEIIQFGNEDQVKQAKQLLANLEKS